MMGCLNCGEKDYRYVGIGEDGEDVIECAECGRIQRFADSPEEGIVAVDDDAFTSVPDPDDDDDDIALADGDDPTDKLVGMGRWQNPDPDGFRW